MRAAPNTVSAEWFWSAVFIHRGTDPQGPYRVPVVALAASKHFCLRPLLGLARTLGSLLYVMQELTTITTPRSPVTKA